MKDTNEIIKDIEIFDLALYLKKYKTLILADLHLGFEEALNKQGTLLPRQQYMKTRQRLEKIFDNLKKNKKQIKEIIVNGDLKHEFGTISEQEWQDTLNILAFLQKQADKVSLIRGNHDNILGPIAQKREIAVLDEKKLGRILILHGDEVPSKIDADILITAHEHPCITLSDGVSSEKEKCFLLGKWKDKTLIVQPAFNVITIGIDVTKEKLLSPFLQQSLDDFKFWVISDKPRYFGKIKDFSSD